MKSDSRRRDRSTARAVTTPRRTKVTRDGIRFHSAWAAKNVENRIAIAAASSAFAVAGYSPRGLHLAEHQQRHGDEDADDNPDGRLQPAVLHGIA